MFTSFKLCLVWLLMTCCIGASQGCGPVLKPTWHQKFQWKAKEYFDDPQVDQLCQAIEASDLEEVERLIATGVDVKAKGKGNMTPLLWAFPDNKPAIFQRLLEAGADPNVIVESDFNTRNLGIIPGNSVTELAAKSSFRDHFKYVMEHGGDPNLVNPMTKNTILETVVTEGAPYTKERLQLLIDKGVDLNQLGPTGVPAVAKAVTYFGQFDIALFLLEAGADPNVYIENHSKKVTHMVALKKTGLSTLSPQQNADFAKLVQWLEDHGQSISEAEADYKRWSKWPHSTEEQARLRKAEIAERQARERTKTQQ